MQPIDEFLMLCTKLRLNLLHESLADLFVFLYQQYQVSSILGLTFMIIHFLSFYMTATFTSTVIYYVFAQLSNHPKLRSTSMVLSLPGGKVKAVGEFSAKFLPT